MPDFDIARFSSPIPGMSLTTEPGGRPWEKPAKFPDPEDALSFYISKLNNQESLNNLFDVLEKNFPVTTLVDSIVLSGVMEGLHSLDVAILLSPALFQFIVGVADIAKIEYVTGLEPSEQTRSSIVTAAIKQAEMEENIEKEEEPGELISIAEEGIAQAETGLMSRPIPQEGEE